MRFEIISLYDGVIDIPCLIRKNRHFLALCRVFPVLTSVA